MGGVSSGWVTIEGKQHGKTQIEFHVPIVILQEGPAPLPQCGNHGIQIPAARLGRHRRTAICMRATDMRLR